jgi:hypothetical protein
MLSAVDDESGLTAEEVEARRLESERVRKKQNERRQNTMNTNGTSGFGRPSTVAKRPPTPRQRPILRNAVDDSDAGNIKKRYTVL